MSDENGNTGTLTSQAAAQDATGEAAVQAAAAAAQGQAAGAEQEDPNKGGQAADDGQATKPPEKPEKPEKPDGAPEKYEFKPADGQPAFDEQVTGAFSEVAKELNLSQEAAQKVLDKMAPVLASRQTETLSAARSQWMNDSKADAEFGGDKLAENLGTAKKAIDAFATQPLKDLLEESGLGNHPEVVRLFVRVGKAIGEDGFVSGRGGSGQAKDARSMYPASNMNS